MDLKAKDAIPEQYKEWFRADLRHAEEWRKEAQIDYDYRDGRQYTDEETRVLEDQGRPPIAFNRIGAIIDAVSGQEISNRQEVRYIPRVAGPAKRPMDQPPPPPPMGHNGGPPMGGPMPPPEMAGPPGMPPMPPPEMAGPPGMPPPDMGMGAPPPGPPPGPPPMEDTGGDTESTELLTSAAMWFRDQADADDNDSEAFRDTITCGMGWTETRLDYEDNPDGKLRDDRLDPFEMIWDYNARKNNLIDATRVWRVRSLPIAEARAFFEGMGVEGIEDDDLHAEWAAQAVWDGKADPHVSESTRDRLAGRRAANGELREAVIAHCQWIEREDVWRVPLPSPDGSTKPQDMSAEEYEAFKQQGAANGVEFDEQMEKALGVRKRKKKVRYQAFLGNIVLKVMPTACPEHFNFKCITAKRDQTKGQFYGIVRSMRDPQSWSNKLYSQILHIINSSAKGGIIVERGAFDNDADAQESWARNDRMTFAKPGALAGPNPKWMPKPVAQVPPALQYLMETAQGSIHQVSGVNMELLGMREADQAGVLEYQRRQAGLTILQPIFDNLKAYRREQGELILWYIQNDLSDGRLIRILGKDEGEYIPLAKQAELEYDIIVDESPTSPNQREKNWQLITQMMPFMKDMMSPEMMMALMEDSPLQSATIRKLQDIAESASSSPQAQMQERMAKLEGDVLESQSMLQAAQAEKTKADAALAMKEAMAPQPDPNAEIALKQQEAHGKLGIAAQESQNKQAIAKQQFEAEMAMKMQKHDAEMEIMRETAASDMRIKSETAAQKKATATDMPSAVSNTLIKLGSQMEAQGKALEQLAKAMTAPKRVLRDPKTNRAIGVETVQ